MMCCYVEYKFNKFLLTIIAAAKEPVETQSNAVVAIQRAIGPSSPEIEFSGNQVRAGLTLIQQLSRPTSDI